MKSRYRWFVAFVLFMFLLLHQADELLIDPLTTPIMEDFQINEAQMGAVSSLAIVVASVLYPVWGYLYDRYARSKLLALASLVVSLNSLDGFGLDPPYMVVTRKQGRSCGEFPKEIGDFQRHIRFFERTATTYGGLSGQCH